MYILPALQSRGLPAAGDRVGCGGALFPFYPSSVALSMVMFPQGFSMVVSPAFPLSLRATLESVQLSA